MSVIALLLSGALSAPLPEPIALASDGQLQCWSPDTARKTCLALATFRVRDDGAIEASAIVQVSSRPPATMEIAIPVEVADGQVCGAVRDQDIDAAAFSLAGLPLDDAQAEPVRDQVRETIRNFIGRRLCVAFLPQGASLLAKPTIDGAPQRGMDQTVIWVAPSQAYVVAP